ncbi:MAG: hypothetical protein ACFFCS_27880 [Candidatus Hodarchaeota archaeon]
MFLIILTIASFAFMTLIQGYMRETIETIDLSNGIPDLIKSGNVGEITLRLFLAPFIGYINPLIPYFSCATIGLLMALNINEKNITPGILRKFLYSGLILVCSSILVGVATGFSIGDREQVIFYHMFILGLETMSVTALLYLVDFRKKTKIEVFAKFTRWIRRFGILTLSLWFLQFIAIFPSLLIEAVTGWPIIGIPKGVKHGGLVDWQLPWYLIIIFLMYHVILLLWEKAGFKGSLEWLTSHALSKGSSSGDRLKMTSILYGSEKMIEHVPEGRLVDAKEKALIIINICFAGFYALVIALIATGTISL